MKIHNFLHRWC